MSSRVLSSLLLVLFLVAPARSQAAEDLFVWKVTAKIAAKMAVIGTEVDRVALRKLSNDNIVNLALGRDLATKVDKNTEVLAGVATFEKPTSSPLARIIVFDPTANGLAQVKAVVMRATNLDYQAAYLNSSSADFGVGTANVLATTLGNPALNGFLPTTLSVAAEGTGSHLGPPDFSPLGVKIKVKGTLNGRLTFNYTERGAPFQFNGFIVKSEVKVSGKPIGMFTE